MIVRTINFGSLGLSHVIRHPKTPRDHQKPIWARQTEG